MFHEKFNVFAGQLLRPDVSTLTLAQALVCEDLYLELQDPPTAEASGEALLASTDLREVKNCHLEAERVRFVEVPDGEYAMAQRIGWMWHAGSRSSSPARAPEIIEMLIAQVAPDQEFDPELLAEELAPMAMDHPNIVAALFTGDLDDVPDLIDEAAQPAMAEAKLIKAAAWMFVTWGGLIQQREACLGWRQIHCPFGGVRSSEVEQRWTIGQIFRPEMERHAFAHRMLNLYSKNLANGVERVEDKRTINSIERKLGKLHLGMLNRRNENAILDRFGRDRFASIPALLQRHAASADVFHRRHRALLAGANGESRAGQRADMLTARISAVHRSAIVCARTFHLAALAAKAKTTDDLRAMLGAGLPEILRPAKGGQLDWDKFRLRQLLHIVRMEFLRDGEHLPKRLKGSRRDHDLPLDLRPEENRRGHELFDHCWSELNRQPRDWRFSTSFGWQCGDQPRVRLRAPGVAPSIPTR